VRDRYPGFTMRPRSTRRLAAGGGILLAMVGLWVGHTAEYARVWGGHGLSAELFGSIHAYMLPLAAVLALLAAAFAARLGRTWARLGRRLDAARARLAAVIRGRSVDVGSNPAPLVATPSVSSGIAVAWPALALLQIGLYLLQENLEALAGGAPAPGFSAITGQHALAPLVHAGVALVLLLFAATALRLVRQRADTVASVEAVVRVLLSRIRRLQHIGTPPLNTRRAPLQLLGNHLARRPPPALISG